MQWKEYYEKIPYWASSTAVSRMSQLESFGPPEEIIDAILDISFDDEKGATRLLKKATAAGVKFSGKQLEDILLCCDKEAIMDAVRFSADRFKTADLDALYTVCDDDFLLGLANQYHIPLTVHLAEWAELCRDELAEDEDDAPLYNREELREELDYILDCLNQAHELLVQAESFSSIDMARNDRAVTVTKYALLDESESYIDRAMQAWEELDAPEKNSVSLPDLQLGINNSTMWNNFLVDGIWVNMSVRRRVRKAMLNVESAIRAIRALRNAL